MVDLYLVRHGESEANVLGTFPHSDTPLTEKGRQEARSSAERLARKLGSHACQLLTSPFLRARQTAEEFEVALGTTAISVEGIRERTYGNLEGKKVGEWRSADEYFRQPGGELVLLESEGAETIDEVALRAGLFLGLVRSGEYGGCVVAVSHGSFIRALLSTIDGVSPIEASQFVPQLPNAHVARRLV